jgi:hypothetical protein
MTLRRPVRDGKVLGSGPGGCPPSRRATLAAALAALAMLAGCAGSGLPAGPSGLPKADSERLAQAVDQARAQHPKFSALGLTRPREPAARAGGPLEPVLTGTGIGFVRGLQIQEPVKAQARLFLDTTSYARGQLVLVEGGREETWPIVAYELKGTADGVFRFTYLLSDPARSLRYLVLVGGEYAEGAAKFWGVEGIVIVPGAGPSLEKWEKAYKFDFGFRYPAQPAYQNLVEEAEGLFRSLARDVPALETLDGRIKAVEGELAALRLGAPEGDAAASRQAGRVATLEERLAEMKDQRAERAEDAGNRAARYYDVRMRLDQAYAEFVTTNPYTWRNLEGRQAFYDRWQTVEFHHPRIDELLARLLPLAPNRAKLEPLRAEAMALFARNNNWDKNPSRKAPAEKAK